MKARPQGAIQGRDFRAELLEREAKLMEGKDIPGKRPALVDMDDDGGKQSIYWIDFSQVKLDVEPSLRKQVKVQPSVKALVDNEERKEVYDNPFPQDADDEDFLKSSDDEKSEKEEEEESDDESDDEKLFEEYERIKREREEEQKRKVNREIEILNVLKLNRISNKKKNWEKKEKRKLWIVILWLKVQDTLYKRSKNITVLFD